MPVKLFVGGLSFSTVSDGLRDAFARFGPVNSATVMTDRETGRSRGFGFVEMATAEDADKAISALNGSSLDGRMIRVDKATPRGSGPVSRGPFRPAGGGPGGFRGGAPAGGGGGFSGPPRTGGPPRPGGFGDRRPSGFPPADPGRGGFGPSEPGGGRGGGPPRGRRGAGDQRRAGDQRPGGAGGPKRRAKKLGGDQGGGRGRRTSDGDFRWGR